MIDPTNFDALNRALREHPDFRGAVIWTREDIEIAAKEHGVDADRLDEAVDFDGWEGVATGEGWDYAIGDAIKAVK